MTDYGRFTEAKIQQVLTALERYGSHSIIALAGVPGTGKSFVASIAAQRWASTPLMVREVQFHPSTSYEEFVEGIRIGKDGETKAVPGLFLDLNETALADPEHRYVLLIEELTRANLPSVLGELLTYIEYRDSERERPFTTMYGRRPVQLAPNLRIIATYNPSDRSALELDSALLRRLRVISFPPDTNQLREMLRDRVGIQNAIPGIVAMFEECQRVFGDEYELLMPFGHGVFARVENEVPDLHELWTERIRYFLRRSPLVEAHPFADCIIDHYPWRDPSYVSGSRDQESQGVPSVTDVRETDVIEEETRTAPPETSTADANPPDAPDSVSPAEPLSLEPGPEEA